MSERGIEIHNGQIILPEGMPQEFHLGTLASPLTQGEAAQVVLSAVINALALGGAIHAGLFSVHGTVSLTGSLTGLHARTEVDAAIVVTGYAYGIHIEQEVFAAGQVTGLMEGIRIEQYIPTGGITLTVHGIYISNYIQTSPTGDYYFIRCAENGGATVSAFMRFSLGGASDADHFMDLAGTESIWAAVGVPTGEGGWIKIQVNSLDRYILLYSTAP